MAALLRAILRHSATARRLSPSLPSPQRLVPSHSLAPSGVAAALFRPAVLRSPLWVFASHFNSYTFQSLTDTRLPRRRPGTASRRKRATMKPKGPFAWIQTVPGEPVPTSQPNEGSIKSRGRKRKKRMLQRQSFMAGEVKKRKAAFAEHKRKKGIERIERKMAAVAREKAWAQRLVELQQLEEAKKAAQAL